MKTKIILGLAIIIVTTIFHVPVSFACSCLSTPTVKESIKKSTAIFSGKVIAIDKKTFEVKFQVYRHWKGVKSKTVSVFSGGNSCSYQFWKGRQFLVYASGKKRLLASICTRTKKLENAKKDLAALGAGRKPK